MKVSVYRTSPITLEKDIERALEDSELAKHYDKERMTFIKINGCYDRNYPGCNTSPWFLDKLLIVLRKLGFVHLTVIESDTKLQPIERTIVAAGIKKVLEKHGIPFLNIEGCRRGNDELPVLIHGAQMISVPVIHTHTFAVMSCASKNLFGLLPQYREKYHNELSETLLRLVRCATPCFTIVDGTVGEDGGSMRMGNPKRLDLVLAGWNPLAIDSVVAKIMGFPANNVPLLDLSMKNGLIPETAIAGDYDSESLPVLHFKWQRSLISQVDLWLRRSSLTRRLFDYNSIVDRLVQYPKRLLLSVDYRMKRKHLFNGLWMEYYTTYYSDV